MRTRSLAVLLLTSRMTASQSRAGLKPTPPLPISASEVRDAADLRMPPLPPVADPRKRKPPLFSSLSVVGSVSWFWEEKGGERRS